MKGEVPKELVLHRDVQKIDLGCNRFGTSPGIGNTEDLADSYLVLKRTDSVNEKDQFGHKQKPSLTFCRGSTTWSANYEQISSDQRISKKAKKGHRRRNTIHTTYESKGFDADQAEPRLVRSSGMRRDWSFEDLRGAGMIQR
ncbi:Detected protein of unknown function [Hibiscus syriacus]|uniref:Uncharacterized protein n=1 Tax=Hibiscus syriacus TaxID=106335 RepID=A0A6A3B7F9_HIBSY|nr:Detected protein of unknown function [Hibiscus syriacus]